MGIKEAIKVFNSQFKDKKVIGYTRYKSFIVVITESNKNIESNYYIVVDSKHVLPTNPIMIDLDEKKIIRL